MKTLAFVAMCGVAHADTITTEPLAVIERGVSLGYEHPIGARWSVVGLAGARAGSLGDYSSRTLTAGAELRWWPLAHMRRLYVSLHASAGRTSVVDDTMDRSIGSSLELTERVDVGYRFVLWHRLTLAPTLGVGDHQDFDLHGRLAPYNAPTAMVGFELGWALDHL